MGNDRSRVLVAHRNRPLAEALVGALASEMTETIFVALATDDAQALINEAQQIQPDIIILDVSSMGQMASTSFDRLRSVANGAKVMMCGVPNCAADILAAIQAGAAAYETCDATLDDLIAKVRGLTIGETICSPEVVSMLFREVASNARTRAPVMERDKGRLTRRELQIIDLVDQGLSNKQIASRLSIGLQTVKNHVHNILE